jgi:hypothetical protein
MAEILGEIIFKRDEQQITPTFTKREFVVRTNDQYAQEILIELHNDKVDILDLYKEGAWVKCNVNIRGRGHVNREGVKQWFNTLVCWKIERT